jgi:hypothetical protein
MRLPRLITLLALVGFSLACAGLTEESPEPRPAEPPIDELHGEDLHGEPVGDPDALFFSSRYDYCDAVVLAGMWGDTDVSSAKTAIGQFLRDGEGALLESKLGWARSHALENFGNRELRCHYSHIGFTYEDAAALAVMWGIDSWEAKMRIEEKYLRDAHDDTHIRAALAEARNMADPEDFEPIQPRDIYAASRYEYCDAVVLGGFWGVGAWDAKAKIGLLIGAGQEPDVAATLQRAQLAAASNLSDDSLRCRYDDIGYSYDDADVLADFWGIDTWDAKVRIEEKYLRDGHIRTHIDEALRLARG